MTGADERDVRARLQALDDFSARSANLGRRLDRDEAAAELVGRLNEFGVPSLVLKGPALARLLYMPSEHRGYYDVDVLVSPDDIGRARAALGSLGYVNASAKTGVDNIHGVVHDESWSRLGGTIDLHRRLAGCDAPPAETWARLYEGRAMIELAGCPVAVLGRDGMALQLALHVAQHGPGGARALADLTRGLERWRPEDWRAAARLGEALEATQTFAAGLRLLPQGAVMAQELGLPPTAELTWAIMNKGDRPRGTFHLRAFSEASGWRGRAEVLGRALFPSRAWIVSQFPWARGGGVVLAAGYVAHLLRTPVWAARAWRFSRSARRLS